MKKVLKRIPASFWWMIGFTVVYFATRLTNILDLPIFTDEAIYIRWSQIGAQDASWRFISLTDGKQPLFTWMVMIALRFVSNPLLAGRIVSVCMGYVAMLGMYVLGKIAWNTTRIGLLCAFLYIIYPFAYVYDRMALYDTTVAALSIWNLIFAILLVRKLQLDIALLFGMTLGLGLLNKTSAFFSLLLYPATLLVFDWKTKGVYRRLIRWIVLALIAGLLSQIIYSILRLSPFFYIVSQKDALFVYPIQEWIRHPGINAYGNIRGMFDWLRSYMGIPLLLVATASCIVRKRDWKLKAVFLIWFFAPFIALGFFGRVIYPRFILFMTMPVLVLCAYTFDWLLVRLPSKTGAWVIILILCLFSFIQTSWLMIDIRHAPLTLSDAGQYRDDWPAGYGVNEVVSTIRNKASQQKVSVYTEGTFGLLPYALEIYLASNPNIDIHGVYPLPSVIPQEIQQSANDHPTYFIINLTQSSYLWGAELVGEYQKGINPASKMRLFKIRPNQDARI